MIIPVPYITTNNKTVGDNKLEKDKGSNHCYNICFPVGLARFFSQCLCPDSPNFSHPYVATL